MTEQEIAHTETLTVEDAEETTSMDVDESQSEENEQTEDTTSKEEIESPDPSTESDEAAEEEEDDGIKRIRKLNSENKSLRNRLREAEDALKNLGTDTDTFKHLVSERDQYKTDYDTLLSSLRTERLTNVMTDMSRKFGAIEPSAVLALAGTSDVAVEYDNTNNPTNVEVVVKSLKAKYPKLFGQIASNGNAGARTERSANLDGLSAKERLRLAHGEN